MSAANNNVMDDGANSSTTADSALGVIEKEPFTTVIAEKGSLVASSQPKIKSNIWAPTLRTNTPGWGLAAVLITLGCCVGAIIIVSVSNGQNVQRWKVQPSVLLAILMATVNATLMFALAGGATNAWWYSVSKGATIAEAQQQWSFGMSLWEAMCAGKHTGIMAIATVVGTWAIFATDPLMQRSTNVISAHATGSVDVVASIAPLIPYGYTGYSTNQGDNIAYVGPTVPTLSVTSDWLNKIPIKTGFTGCKGNCTGTVPAAGFAVNCTERRLPVDYYAKYRAVSSNTSDLSYTVPQLAFNTNFTSSSWSLSASVTVAYVDSIDDDCVGFMTVRDCHLQAATIEYPISITNDVVTIGDVSSPKVLALQNATAYSQSQCLVDCPIYARTAFSVAGIALTAQRLYNSSVMLTNVPISTHTYKPWIVTYEGALSSQSQNVAADKSGVELNDCNVAYTSPMNGIIQTMNEMMFRTALKASNTSLYDHLEGFNHPGKPVAFVPLPSVDGIPRNTTITMTQSRAINVYSSDFRFLGAAVAIILLSLLLIMPLYYGFWTLGRRVSMSPLETAKAFGAPLLGRAGSNMEAKEMVGLVGTMRVRYGEVLREESGVQVCSLEIAEAEGVQAPRRGVSYL